MCEEVGSVCGIWCILLLTSDKVVVSRSCNWIPLARDSNADIQATWGLDRKMTTASVCDEQTHLGHVWHYFVLLYAGCKLDPSTMDIKMCNTV